MEIYRFAAQVGIFIDKFGSSNFVLSRIVPMTEQGLVSCFYLGIESRERETPFFHSLFPLFGKAAFWKRRE